MGSLFRSEEMALCQLFLQSEGAYSCISELGELGAVQFRDLNPGVNAFQRKFVNEVRRCDEMERKLRYLEKEIKKDEIELIEPVGNPEAPQPREMIDLEANFEKLENELREINTNDESLKKNFLELIELKYILNKTQVFFDEHQQNAVDLSLEGSSSVLVTRDAVAMQVPHQIGFVAGVILRERLPAFERMLWRACHGNVFLRQVEIEDSLADPISGDRVNKSAFIIFFQGDQLKTKVKKICEGFHATLYPCPETPTERRDMALGVTNRIEDLNTVLSQTQDHRRRVLAGAAKNVKTWFVKVCKIKAIYHTLNMFNLDVTANCLIAECWCPVSTLETIQLALRRGTERSGATMTPILNRMSTNEKPPTHIKTNKFTHGFQAIVDAYGVGDYREVNPALFTIITFPFLFAVMFGDAGHGLIMALFAGWMVYIEKRVGNKKIEEEISRTFYEGRYIILLMGIFSIYTGLIYNDVFSKSLNIFGSSWYPNFDDGAVNSTASLVLNANSSMYYGTPYPFGIDPVWQLATNKLTFLNSYKMKVSVILGVLHMLTGIAMSLGNHIHFKKPVNIFCEFIPQVIFLSSIFGYLVILIFWKWTAYDGNSSSVAPSLLIGLINMFMLKYDYKADALYARPFYSSQEAVEMTLVFVALLCVPWMLLVKPYILWRNNKRAQLEAVIVTNATTDKNDEDEAGTSQETPKAEEFQMGTVMINQSIHTIEFCLGCISNTASYLRLWALSLAHAQLSEVLWSMIFHSGLTSSNYMGAVMVYFVFPPWAVLTVAVLLVMEGLSAFLHALRLHWVEFQNKFYGGNGFAFTPFSFYSILDAQFSEE